MLLFKSKVDLNGHLEFLDSVFFNEPSHLQHFKPVYMVKLAFPFSVAELGPS